MGHVLIQHHDTGRGETLRDFSGLRRGFLLNRRLAWHEEFTKTLLQGLVTFLSVEIVHEGLFVQRGGGMGRLLREGDAFAQPELHRTKVG